MAMPVSIAAADCTEDGLPDAAVLQACTGEVEILVNAGGFLVPLPILTSASVPAGPAGSLALPVAGGMGPGSLYLQAIAPDPAQPKGFEVSNALRLDLFP